MGVAVSPAGTRFTVRLTSIAETVAKARQGQVLRSHDIGRHLMGSPFVPGVLKNLKDTR